MDHTATEVDSKERVVRVLARGLQILKAFEPKNTWLSNQDIATRTGLPKPTVSRITATLTGLGYLTYSYPRRLYRLAPSVVSLGYFAATNLSLTARIRPMMQALANQEDALVVLAERDHMNMVCSEVCHSEQSVVSLRVHRGSRLMLAHSAVGRAYLGALPESRRTEACKEILQRQPHAQEALRSGIAHAADEIAARAFCVTMESLERGINGVAVALHTPSDPHRYALGCAAPSFYFSREHLEHVVGPALVAIKRRIEAHLLPDTPAVPN